MLGNQWEAWDFFFEKINNLQNYRRHSFFTLEGKEVEK